MKGPTDEQLLAFLEGRMSDAERRDFLTVLEGDAEVTRRLRHAAAAHSAVLDTADVERALRPRPTGRHPTAPPAAARPARRPASRTTPWWWIPLTAAATLAVTLPVASRIATNGSDTTGGVPTGAVPTDAVPTDAVPINSGPATIAGGLPASAAPSFVLVLHGRWPDAASVSPADARSRASVYWDWTTRLAREGVLVAAGDLRWEPGERIEASGSAVPVAADAVEDADFIVGMFALRVATYEEAVAVARECPHLRFGGSLSVRQVGGGFVTVPGMDDWTE